MSTIFSPVLAASVTKEYEKTLTIGTESIASFRIKVVIETEQDGSWTVSPGMPYAPGYKVTFLITLENVTNKEVYGQYTPKFYSPFVQSSGNVDQRVLSNDTGWLVNSGDTGKLEAQLFCTQATRYELTDFRFSFDAYNQSGIQYSWYWDFQDAIYIDAGTSPSTAIPFWFLAIGICIGAIIGVLSTYLFLGARKSPHATPKTRICLWVLFLRNQGPRLILPNELHGFIIGRTM